MPLRRLISQTPFRRAARRMIRELLICVALPAVLLVSANVVAQKTDASQKTADQQVTDAINSQLKASSVAQPVTFNVWVHDGTATLSGRVSSAAERQQVDTVVRGVAGVKTLDDQVVVETAPETAPQPPAEDSAAPQGEEHPSMPPPPPPTEEEQRYAGTNRGPASYPPQMVTVRAGTPIYVLMLRPVGSKHTKPGERFRGLLAKDIVLQNGAIAVPRGATLDGTVIDARPAGHLKGRPKLALQLSSVEMAESSYPLTSSIWAHEGPGKGGQTTANVAGSAAVGAFAGGVVGGGPTALLGGVLGGLGGAGLSALSHGPRLFVPAESVLTFYLNAPLTVREPTPGEIRASAANVPPRYGYRQPPPYPYGPGYAPAPPPPGPPGGYPY